MKLLISHKTTYRYETPVSYALLQLRLAPSSGRGQEVQAWNVAIAGGRREVTFRDHFQNSVDLVSLDSGTESITITSGGCVTTEDTSGISGPHTGFAPLWLFLRKTELTSPGPRIRRLVREARGDDDIARLHALSEQIRDAIAYRVGDTDVTTSAEEAVSAGSGVCQDHTHVFVSAARELGFPSRYVSGHLFTAEGREQSAAHAWAEAHVDGLGWVGFDVSNGISPDKNYVRVATGLDYLDAAPVTGMRLGSGSEELHVSLQVQQ